MGELSRDELERALAPVREHFRSNRLTTNTVLAAHLRALGTQPRGVVWDKAKALVKQGHSFPQAAAEASGNQSDGSRPMFTARGTPRTDPTPSSRGRSRPATRAAAERPKVASEGPDATEHEQSPSDQLSWFPKRFREGDLDGHGARRLLGVPNASKAEVLVRETAQNSWDARLGGATPVNYELHLRPASDEQRQTLRERVFTGDDADLGLSAALEGDELWLLEVSDRGTTGLGGPVRNDIVIPPGVSTDFADFVFTIGAARDKHLGGGTYGFGKSISYLVSEPGTLLIWSRSREDDGLEDRLIGSAVGYPFDRQGVRYTGRHWWGVAVGAGPDRVEPLVGAPAKDLGSHLYSRGFGAEQTGTSLLIIAPQLDGDSREQEAENLARSVLWHLWPKLHPDDESAGRTHMTFSVKLDGEEVPIPDPSSHPVLVGHTVALDAVRAAQRNAEFDPPLPTSVEEIWCHNPKQLLGHLAFARYPVPWSEGRDHEEGVPIKGASRHVCLMRHEAELVVRYHEQAPLDTDGFQWAAVFKPVETVDDDFATAEPPAHDDWIPDMLPRRSATHVRVAKRRIREAVGAFLRPNMQRSTKSSPISAVAVGNALADLVGPLEGARATRTTRAGRSRSGTGRTGVSIEETRLGPRAGDMRTIGIRFRAESPNGEAVPVAPRVRIGLDDGSEADDGASRVLGWTEEEPDLESPQLITDETFNAPSDSDAWLVLEVAADLAVDVRLSRVATDAA